MKNLSHVSFEVLPKTFHGPKFYFESQVVFC